MPDLGSIPDWISGLGSAGAFAAALLLVRGEARARREDRLAEQVRQARLVAMGALKATGSKTHNYTWDIRLDVMNRSDHPVVELEAQLYPREVDSPMTVPPPLTLERLDAFEERALEWRHAEGLHFAPDEVGKHLIASITFTDVEGRRWKRSHHGFPVLEVPQQGK